VDYAEGIYVGYRYFDTKNVEPQFPFGFGLSYTNFEYSDLRVVHAVTHSGTQKQELDLVSVDVKNTGARDGAEVVELYVHDGHAKIDRPTHELKGFQRVELRRAKRNSAIQCGPCGSLLLEPGEKDWIAEPGTFEIQVGASSRDIRLRGRWS